MATVHDVARYILRKQGAMSTWKLQKLVYYAQAWHLVWDEAPLFPERIEAWANGPVVRELYRYHRGLFEVSDWSHENARIAHLTASERGTMDGVLKFYGHRSGRWLSALTHQERPWNEARHGLQPGARSDREITPGMMADYYGQL
jgi:uncharacterized phage-associated protein